MVHQKVKDIPSHTTTETMKDSFFLVHGKGGRLLRMKRAKSNMIATQLFQGQMIGNDLHDGGALPNL